MSKNLQVICVDTLSENKSFNDEGILEQLDFSYPVFIYEIRILYQDAFVNVGNRRITGKTPRQDELLSVYGLDLGVQRELHTTTFELLGQFNVVAGSDSWSAYTLDKKIPVDRIVIKSEFKLLTVAIIGLLADPSDFKCYCVLHTTEHLSEEDRAADLPNPILEQTKCDPLVERYLLGDHYELATTQGQLDLSVGIERAHASSDSEEDFADFLPPNLTQVSLTADDDSTYLCEAMQNLEVLDDLIVPMKPNDLKTSRSQSIPHSVSVVCNLLVSDLPDMEVLNCLNWLNEMSTDTLTALFLALPIDRMETLLRLMRRSIMPRDIFLKMFQYGDVAALKEGQYFQLRVWSYALELVGLILPMELDPDRTSLIESMGYFDILLDLFADTSSSTTLKMRVLRCLDKALSSASRLKQFIPSNKPGDKISGYERCLKWMASKKEKEFEKSSRLLALLSRVLCKVHFYNELVHLNRLSKTFIEDNQPCTSTQLDAVDADVLERLQWLVTLVIDCSRNAEESKLIEDLSQSVASIAFGFRYASAITDLPAKSWFRRISKTMSAVRCQVEVDFSRDRRPRLRLLTDCNFVKILRQVSKCLIQIPDPLTYAIEDFIRCLLLDVHGIDYFIANQLEFIELGRWILQNDQQNNSNRIPALIAYTCRVLKAMDRICNSAVSADNVFEHFETMLVVSNLDSIGRFVTSSILSVKRYQSPLCERLNAGYANDPCFRPIVQLLTQSLLNLDLCKGNFMVMKYCKEVGMEVWKILQTTTSKQLKLFTEHLYPCSLLRSFDHGDTKALAESLQNIMALTENILKPRTATIIKLLCAICIPGKVEDPNIHQRHAICELYSMDGLLNLCCVLDNIYKMFLRSWQLGVPFESQYRLLSDNMVRCSVLLMRQMLNLLSESNGSKNFNVNPIRSLFRIYCILPACLVPDAPETDVADVRLEIVNCLLSYTRGNGPVNRPCHSIQDCSWCIMLSEICRQIASAPQFFIGGVSILRSLMPPVLPISAEKDGTSHNEQVARLLRGRKDVANHVNCLKQAIYIISSRSFDVSDIISLCAPISNPWLQQNVCAFCARLADLSADLCDFTIRLVFDTLISDSNKTGQPPTLYSSSSVSLLSLLSTLMLIPSCKACFIILIDPASEDTHYYHQFCRILKQFDMVSDNPYHLFCQTTILSLVETLCDPTILLSPSKDGSGHENTLPSIEATEKIVEVFVAHVCDHRHSCTSTALALVALTQIHTDYPSGDDIVCRYLLQTDGAVADLIEKLDCKFDKDDQTYMNALSATINFLRLVVMANSGNRIYTFSNKQLRDLFRWDQARHPQQSHPFTDFVQLLREAVGNNEITNAITSPCERIALILLRLSDLILVRLNEVNDRACASDVGFVLGSTCPRTPDPLHDQFDRRKIFCNRDESCFSTIGHINGLPWYIPHDGVGELRSPHDNFEDICEMVNHDLELTVSNCLKPTTPTMSVVQSLIDEYHSGFTCLESPSRHSAISDKVIATSQRPGHRNYVAPMRGFGFNRNIVNRLFTNSRSAFNIRSFSHSLMTFLDPLRQSVSRGQPGSSRAPSLHVDEFCHFQPSTNLALPPCYYTQAIILPQPNNLIDSRLVSPFRQIESASQPHLFDVGCVARMPELKPFNECNPDMLNDFDDTWGMDLDEDKDIKHIRVGICAMENKVIAKPMEEILCRLEKFPHLHIIIFPQPVIIHLPAEDWPRCDCLICFQSAGFPLDKAKRYVDMHKPFLINDVDMQYNLLNRVDMYRILDEAGVLHPMYIVIRKGDEVVDDDDQIKVDGVTLSRPFVEKPLNADDHNVYIYFQSSVGGGCQRLFRKIGCRSSIYSNVNKIRNDCDFIYEQFMPTDGIDVKVYTVGSEYAHAEARKSPGLDGKVERDEFGKEVRYPIILRSEEKLIARKICLAFKQTVCGFDLLRANGKSYVCDVNGFSFVKNSVKYYDDCSLILGNMIMRVLSPQFAIPYSPCYRPEDVPIVETTYGTMMELRCVIAVIRHGDRTPKQKMKMDVSDQLFVDFFARCGGEKNTYVKLKRPSDLQAVLDITRQLIKRYDDKLDGYDKDKLPEERLEKLMQLKSVLEMYGHFSGINRKVQMKRRTTKASADSKPGEPNKNDGSDQSILFILKWGGELTDVGRKRAMLLGEAFRKMYPGSRNKKRAPDTGLLRLHSTYRHDLKIYASDEGRVQMTAAAFTKGLLALEGQLAPILVQMVKSANTNGLLDDNWESVRLASSAKEKLSEFLTVDRVLTYEDIWKIVPTGQKALIDKLREIGNPLAACRAIFDYIRQMTDHIRMKMMDSNSYKLKLYHSESWELVLRRWAKLEKDFYDRETNTFDFGKVSVIYDCIKHDYVYNQRTLQFTNARELYLLSKLLSEVVVPQEYGLQTQEKLKIARGIISPLLTKIRTDLRRNVDLGTKAVSSAAVDPPPSSNPREEVDEEECDSRLDPRRLTEDERSRKGIQTPGRHVRTRLYFTSESHVHSLINILKYGELLKTPNSQWTAAVEHLETVAELGYLTQIIIKLFEDPNVPRESDNRFHVEIHFSPGSSEDVVPETNLHMDAPPDNSSMGIQSQASSDRPIALGQPLISFPINDQSMGVVRRTGSHDDMRNRSRVSSQDRSNSTSNRRISRDYNRFNVEEPIKTACKPCNQSINLQIPAIERSIQFREFLAYNEYQHTYTCGLGEEQRSSVNNVIRTESLDDPSLEFVTATSSSNEYNQRLSFGQNDLYILHNSLNARDFNLFLERMLDGVSQSAKSAPDSN